MGEIKFIKGAASKSVYPLLDHIKFGSDKSTDICMNDPQVAPVHAFLVKEGGDYFLRNLQPQSMIFVNEEPFSGSIKLYDQDIIRIGLNIFKIAVSPQRWKGKIYYNRYQITKLLIETPFTLVFRVMDINMNREMLILIITANIFKTHPKLLDEIKHEVEQIGSIYCDNIAQLYDLGIQDGDIYFVYNAIDTELLYDKLKSQKSMTSQDILKIARDVTRALSIIHSKNWVHYNLNPVNILVCKDRGLLLGAGILYVLARSTLDGISKCSVINDYRYISPEQARNESVTFSSDLYSLGMIMYEMLTGQCLFSGSSLPEILQKMKTAAPLGNELDGNKEIFELTYIIKKLLNPDPCLRYQNTNELIQDLEIALLIYQYKTHFCKKRHLFKRPIFLWLVLPIISIFLSFFVYIIFNFLKLKQVL